MTNASASTVRTRRGTLCLRPLEASCDRGVRNVEIDLERDDAVLTLGDLRRAAERLDDTGDVEAAHRLWAMAAEAAGRVDPALGARFTERSRACATRIAAPRTAHRRRIRFDYRQLADARRSGRTAADVALEHGCSTSTVRRAVDIVEAFEELCLRDPGVLEGLDLETDPTETAAALGVDAAVVRWMYELRLDRRR